jgi:5-deoxy-glucuronate isomerase
MKQVRSVTPESEGWTYLAFEIIELSAGESSTHSETDREQAVVPLSGTATLGFDGSEHVVSRSSVFTELAPVGYVPPGVDITVTAGSDPFTYAVGSAPAEGLYGAKLVKPSTIRSEIRGGGQALRQVNHTLAMPIEAERLILYEVYVPRGTWSGWSPHCHDGFDGSPYLEEVYYFRMDRPEGFWFHRNWRDEGAEKDIFNDLHSGGDGDLATVPRGYHTSVACPGANMYFLNYLAGELVGDDRRTPPCFHSDFTWIENDWTAGQWGLPVVTNGDIGG